MKKQLKITILSAQLILFTITAKPQNFWEQNKKVKSIIEVADTACPVYNAYDDEVTIDWQYIIDEGETYDRAMDIDFTPDSNFVFLNLYGKNFYCINKDDGSTIWKKSFFVNDTDQFYGQKFITIGNYYYISGWWGEWAVNGATYFGILKTNLNGEKIWLKTIGHSKSAQKNVEYINPVIINVEETNFLVSLDLNNDLKIEKYDSSCNKIWELSENDIGFDGSFALRLCFDGNDYLIYYSNFLAKVNSNGNFLGLLNDNVSNIYGNINCYDKFYCSGYDYYGENKKQWIRRYSKDFNLEMQYSISIESQNIISFASSIKILNDKSILIFHDYEYYEGWDYEIHTNFNIRHIDKYGNCISTLNLYEYGSQHTTELLLTKDEDYILFGYGYEDFTGRDLTVIAKVHPWDVTGVETVKNQQNKVNIFPNPVINELNIEFDIPYTGSISIYTLNGRVLFMTKVNEQKKLSINTNFIDKGVYLIHIKNNKYNVFQKLIK